MKLAIRNYRDEDDFWRIRQFLRETLVANDLCLFSWNVQRLDYWRFFGMNNVHPGEIFPNIIFLWETPDGRIAAVLHPEEAGDCFLQVHAAFRALHEVQFLEALFFLTREAFRVFAGMFHLPLELEPFEMFLFLVGRSHRHSGVLLLSSGEF